jgi:hypothetical protein
MNQVEQWFSILQRKRLRAPNFADLADLEAKILAFIDEWNEIAHPFHWTTHSCRRSLGSPPALDRLLPQEGSSVMGTNLRGDVRSSFGMTSRMECSTWNIIIGMRVTPGSEVYLCTRRINQPSSRSRGMLLCIGLQRSSHRQIWRRGPYSSARLRVGRIAPREQAGAATTA